MKKIIERSAPDRYCDFCDNYGRKCFGTEAGRDICRSCVEALFNRMCPPNFSSFDAPAVVERRRVNKFGL